MSQTVYLFYARVLSTDGKTVTIGGVQSYLIALSQVIQSIGWAAVLVQIGDVDFDAEVRGVPVWGRKISPKQRRKSYLVSLYDRVKSDIQKNKGIVIWGLPDGGEKIPGAPTISIQHGISFDLVRDRNKDRFLKSLGLHRLQKFRQHWIACKTPHNSDHLVCVDYNYQNWYRTFSDRTNDSSLTVIPNFSRIPEWEIAHKKQFQKVVFARRFAFERGSPIMIEAVESLLNKNAPLEFTFAGDGPYRPQIEALQAKFPNQVTLTKYAAEESLDFHRQFDIAVIPTFGSEGTSLSLLEAMAAGCAVICTDVGGMTNIVIDQFNGLMVPPEADAVEKAIESIAASPDTANQMCRFARDTVEKGFSETLWAQRWESVLRNVADLPKKGRTE
jgi:glycosyltransferase involved in cell wall biosynthesis